MDETELELFAACPRGMEKAAADEIRESGGTGVRIQGVGLTFRAKPAAIYELCLRARLLNRILLPLKVGQIKTAGELYQLVRSLDWTEFFDERSTFAVDFQGVTEEIRNSHFGALKVKDAVVDQLQDKTGKRPDVDRENPDVLINVILREDRVRIRLDLSGGSLHKRGYRSAGGEAPLKENLAAALVQRADFPALFEQGYALFDPCCGSATLLIEAVLKAANYAPGLFREKFGFQVWPGFDPQLWKEVRERVKAESEQGLKNLQGEFFGCDEDRFVLEQARQNVKTAGLEDHIILEAADFRDYSRRLKNIEKLLVLVNPPYGERLSDEKSLKGLYQDLGGLVAGQARRRLALFTASEKLAGELGLLFSETVEYKNAMLDCRLYLANGDAIKPHASELLSEDGRALANRLRKNLKYMGRWARKNQVECWRLYDADLPQYKLAVDLYQDLVHVQEYAPPESIPRETADKRLKEALAAIEVVLEKSPEQLYLKERKRQRGQEQYERLEKQDEFIEMQEGGCRLLVNLADYLDTGLFLDHRPLRLRIQEEAAGKSFLNLFCYTGVATLHAARGGARTSESVDLSAVYLDWAFENFKLNNMGENHLLTQKDIRSWLETNRRSFDLILLDPPTFSNSKKLDYDLDIQRDHVELIQDTLKILNPGGVLYFSNNHRKFKLDQTELEGPDLEITDISAATIDRDFERNPRIHTCWRILEKG